MYAHLVGSIGSYGRLRPNRGVSIYVWSSSEGRLSRGRRIGSYPDSTSGNRAAEVSLVPSFNPTSPDCDDLRCSVILSLELACVVFLLGVDLRSHATDTGGLVATAAVLYLEAQPYPER